MTRNKLVVSIALEAQHLTLLLDIHSIRWRSLLLDLRKLWDLLFGFAVLVVEFLLLGLAAVGLALNKLWDFWLLLWDILL